MQNNDASLYHVYFICTLKKVGMPCTLSNVVIGLWTTQRGNGGDSWHEVVNCNSVRRPLSLSLSSSPSDHASNTDHPLVHIQTSVAIIYYSLHLVYTHPPSKIFQHQLVASLSSSSDFLLRVECENSPIAGFCGTITTP